MGSLAIILVKLSPRLPFCLCLCFLCFCWSPSLAAPTSFCMKNLRSCLVWMLIPYLLICPRLAQTILCSPKTLASSLTFFLYSFHVPENFLPFPILLRLLPLHCHGLTPFVCIEALSMAGGSSRACWCLKQWLGLEGRGFFWCCCCFAATTDNLDKSGRVKLMAPSYCCLLRTWERKFVGQKTSHWKWYGCGWTEKWTAKLGCI